LLVLHGGVNTIIITYSQI